MVRKRRAESVAYDKEEEKLMASVENEEWISVDNLEEEIEKAQAVARATFKKSERMNIRISQKDLNGLKVRAMEEGIPYQTLVSSIIHKYLSGRLMEP
jgi:predicted DNA binding CopG/RHH family protein